jgi:hypothetical protein
MSIYRYLPLLSETPLTNFGYVLNNNQNTGCGKEAGDR